MRADSLHSRTRKDRLAELLIGAAEQYRPGSSFTVLDLYMAEPRLHEYSRGEVSGMCRKVFVKAPVQPKYENERRNWMLPND